MKQMRKCSPELQKTVRYRALDSLIKVQQQQAYANLVLDRALRTTPHADQKDQRLLTELVYGTISREMTLDFYLAPFINKAKKMDEWVRQLLRMAVYQLVYLDRIPAHAVLYESVELAKQGGNPGIGKFVNGVLRSIQRKGVPAFSELTGTTERLAIELSMPAWLVQKFITQLGIEETRRLGESLFTPSRVSARLDTRFISRPNALAIWEAEGINGEESQVSPYGLIAKKGFLAGSSLFAKGQLTIQDESSMLVAPAMQIKPWHRVLDACAAPGGKTTHIATYLAAEQGGQVSALDLHPHKVRLIEENAKRMNVSEEVSARQLDARDCDQIFADEYFDRILVDAPCSGLGLMRRKPDVKYHKKPADLQTLPKIQLEILEKVAPKLKVGGILVYSTCTIMREENQKVTDEFLARHPEFAIIPVAVNDYVKPALDGSVLSLFPHQFMTDGFYICCMQRMTNEQP